MSADLSNQDDTDAGEEAPAITAPYTYTLKYPVDLVDAKGNSLGRLTELVLNRLTGRDMEKLDFKAGGAAMVQMLAASARVPPSSVRFMDAEDVTAAGGIVAGFLGGYHSTGAK